MLLKTQPKKVFKHTNMLIVQQQTAHMLKCSSIKIQEEFEWLISVLLH